MVCVCVCVCVRDDMISRSSGMVCVCVCLCVRDDMICDSLSVSLSFGLALGTDGKAGVIVKARSDKWRRVSAPSRIV